MISEAEIKIPPLSRTRDVRDAFAGNPTNEAGLDALSYASGRVEGEALRRQGGDLK